MISLVYAASENDVIGREGGLPWDLPKDMRHFKRLTLDHAIVMGRKTWQSVEHPLPRRRSIVVSRDPDFEARGGETATSLEAALELVREGLPEGAEIFVIGGAGIFEAALPHAERIYRTRVHAEVEGDVTFSPDLEGWELLEEEHHPADERHDYPFTFQLLARRAEAATPDPDQA